MGSELETNPDIFVQLVAGRSATKSVLAAVGRTGRDQAVQGRRPNAIWLAGK
jgi:hypothetical protein